MLHNVINGCYYHKRLKKSLSQKSTTQYLIRHLPEQPSEGLQRSSLQSHFKTQRFP